MWRHCVEKHDNNEQEFKFKVRQVFGKDMTLRQVKEAIDIRKEGNINNKMEWGHTVYRPPKTSHRKKVRPKPISNITL